MFTKILQKSNSTLIKNQIRLFSQSLPLYRVENVMILGSGLMGSGIAQSCATTGKFDSITLYDVSQDQLNKAQDRIVKSLSKLKERKKINIGTPEETTSRITMKTELKPISEKNLLIIEAVPEVLELKQEIFKELGTKFGSNPSTIFATNTSTLPCRLIHVHLEQKNQFAALHFFNPVPMMKLVEIARTPETKADIIDSLRQFVLDIDHVPVECKDTPGFIVNRLFMRYHSEALALFERGDASIEDIDTAMKLGAGYPMGPFELADYVGLDTQLLSRNSFLKHDPSLKSTVQDPKTLKELVSKGNFGRKTGKGFYNYGKNGEKLSVNVK